MIERVIELSIRHRGLVIAAGLVLALWGVYAVYQTPMDAVPDLSENQVIVFTEWSGHGPREIEDQVTYPLSRNLQSLEGLRAVRGSSDVGFSSISLIFEEAVDYATARSRVLERLPSLDAELPSGVRPRLAPDAIPTGQIFWYTLEGKGYDLARLRSVQDWYVRHQLESVPGVAEVASVGGQVLEYHVDLDPHRLRDRGVELADVRRELSRSNAAVGGDVIHKGNAEFIVRGVGWLGAGTDESAEPDPVRVVRDLEELLIRTTSRGAVPLREVARVSLGTKPRRGIFEKDGNEVTGGVILLRYGHNPLEVTERIKQKIADIQAGLPAGMHLVPCYDRTPLIKGAVHTVAGTLVEAIVTASVCVVLVLLHLRTSFVIAVTLPLAALASFVLMWLLRRLGVADIQTNIMSLAGIAISIGVLVDSSIVMAENAMFHLREKFGDRAVRGDVRQVVLPACRTVGRPIFFAVLIMLVSFLPVFALGGVDGKMYRPLAFTKSFALIAVAVLSITLVPALCTIFIKGRLRRETESWVVRNVIDVYRPILNYLLDRPGPLVWILGATLVLGAAPLGNRMVLLPALFVAVVTTGLALRTAAARAAGIVSLVLLALVAEQQMKPIQIEMRMPLDEGMVMDMPITVPRASSVQAGDDLKARDMQLCRFPEVEMVVGKAGRAESPFDPAPLDMIETMIMFRPREFWPRRKLEPAAARRHASEVLESLLGSKLIEPPADDQTKGALLDEALSAAMPRFDSVLRELAYQQNQEFVRGLRPELTRFLVEQTVARLARRKALSRPIVEGEIALIMSHVASHASEHLAMSLPIEDVTRMARHTVAWLADAELLRDGAEEALDKPGLFDQSLAAVGGLLGAAKPTFFTALRDDALERYRALWLAHVDRLNRLLLDRAPGTLTRAVAEEILARGEVTDPKLLEIEEQIAKARRGDASKPQAAGAGAPSDGHHRVSSHGPLPVIDPHPVLDKLYSDLTARLAGRIVLWQRDREELSAVGGELDNMLKMPGWGNVWTRPIQNRVDMLSTGVITEVGVRVIGKRLEDVVRASEEIGAVIGQVWGAQGVNVERLRGKSYVDIRPDRQQAARLGVVISDIADVIETALGGTIVTTTLEGRERYGVRLGYLRDWSEDEESIRRLPVPVRGLAAAEGPAEQPLHNAIPAASPLPAGGSVRYVPLEQVASIRVVEGPASIKSENGLLRNYVKLNVLGRNVLEFVEAARRAVEEQVELPEGTYVEWTGQFEHTLATTRTLSILVPVVVGLIFLILYLTYRDWADAVLMLLAVPGAVAGGVLFQWLFGFRFSVAVGVGYIACFGMAAATGMIMLVYLREAIERAGGLEAMSLPELRQAVMNGAVHRLRPKLLTEATTILGLAPMLWATGVGAEVIRPMAAPVLGGILIADEVIDLLLPVLFYHVRRRRWQRLHPAAVPDKITLAIGPIIERPATLESSVS